MRQQDELNRMFEAIDDEGRDIVLDILAGEFERVQASRRARLRLVHCTHSVPNVPHHPIDSAAIEGAG